MVLLTIQQVTLLECFCLLGFSQGGAYAPCYNLEVCFEGMVIRTRMYSDTTLFIRVFAFCHIILKRGGS